MGTAKSELGPRIPSTRQRVSLMSTVRAEAIHPEPEPSHRHIVRRTIEACHLAKEAASAAAEGIATGSAPLLNSLRQRERDLDTLDREIDTAVTTAITEVEPPAARELLACMKFMISLERIGDLLLSFANSAQAASGRIDSEDTRLGHRPRLARAACGPRISRAAGGAQMRRAPTLGVRLEFPTPGPRNRTI